MKKKATYDPEIRSHVITVRMNEEEWSDFQSQRKKLGEMSQSDFIRQAVTTGADQSDGSGPSLTVKSWIR